MPTLHPQIVKAIEAMQRAGMKPIESLTPAEARTQMEDTAKSRKADRGFYDYRGPTPVPTR